MTAAATSPAAVPTTVSPRHALLEGLIATATAMAAEELRALTTGIVAALLDGTAQADGALQARLRAGNLLRERQFAFLHLASAALERELRGAIAQLRPAPVASPLDLALVPYEAMDQQVTLDSVARPFDSEHADALAALGARLAVMLDRPVLRARQNPFRPEVFIGALQQAWVACQGDETAVPLLLPLLRPGRCYDFGAILAALNLALERAGVALPGRPKAAAHDASAGRRQQEAVLADGLQRLFARAPAPAEAAAGGADAGPLLAWLAAQPRGAGGTRLHGLKAQAPAGTVSHTHATTIDLLDAVFDTVAADGDIAADIRDLIQLAQLPVLKAALRDQGFFFEADHPARRLLDLLSRMGWERAQVPAAGPHDPLLAAMRHSVATVTADGAADGGANETAFAQAVTALEASLRADEAATEAALAAPVAAALRQERQAAAAQAARAAVAQRLAEAEGAGNAAVAAFLRTRWTDVLTVAHTLEERKPGAVRNAMQAMDELLWSVAPKAAADERRRLIARLPALLAVLNRWLDVIRWQDAERLRFFAELAECHAALVRAPLDLAPARQVALAVEATRLAAERRQATAVAAPPVAAPLADPAVQAVDALVRGAWLEFAGTAGSAPRRVKLAWISPLRTLYIFSNGAREEAFSLAHDVLARHLREGSATVLAAEPLVTRALGRAIGALAGNDADGGVRAA
ncbi:hypothetical protein C9I28_17560 [Pseudoduganella armeniaca]|uniref:DUF1631 family protein n=2 Tax=Pseudoduganella armeniaca TaxID=2072590 RepID=A0A2R4CI66_9BURK|nr:hypothetical protein C9I28_17560 [Pseudoduganella armeniaca]